MENNKEEKELELSIEDQLKYERIAKHKFNILLKSLKKEYSFHSMSKEDIDFTTKLFDRYSALVAGDCLLIGRFKVEKKKHSAELFEERLSTCNTLLPALFLDKPEENEDLILKLIFDFKGVCKELIDIATKWYGSDNEDNKDKKEEKYKS